jgi:hypothetical protein
MSRQYSPKGFLRQVPNQLLRTYFLGKGFLEDLQWHLQSEHEVEHIHTAWQALPYQARHMIENDFRQVDELACEQGVHALVEEGRFHGLDLAREFEGRPGNHHKAMWTFLTHPDVFAVASLINYVDHLHGRSWTSFIDLPAKPPTSKLDGLNAFENALSELYVREEGRGQRCTVESYLRGDRYLYLFAYLDDYTDTFIGHADDGKLVRRAEKRAFELVFLYDPVDRTLGLFAKGGKERAGALVQLFTALVLGKVCNPARAAKRAYELDGLLRRDFSTATDPEDGVEEVRVRKLRLSTCGNGSNRLTFEADPRGPVQGMYDLIEQFLPADIRLPVMFHVTQAMFEFRFACVGCRRPKPLVFTITFPNTSDLASRPDEYRVLGEKYLKRWGLYDA